jgi:hypothetical protein
MSKINQRLRDWACGGTNFNALLPEAAAHIETTEKQRDELLAALKSLVEDLELRSSFKTGSQKNVVDCGNGVYLQAKNAITKAEGGAA